ncbi:MAG: TatD family hydrolase [Treponema sp.]|jgi:TatD DNase family protein|nr:TatD family hydrolase [Treponema sp.]
MKRVFLDMGFYIPFAGNITFKNAQNLPDALQSVPLNRLFLETQTVRILPPRRTAASRHTPV